MEKVTAAAVQATPVFLHHDETVDKACRLIKEAGSNGAGLVVFPETFIPAYPDWVWRAGVWDEVSEALYARLYENSVVVPGPATEALAKAAKRAKVYVSMGVDEREEGNGTIYNTQLYFGPDGSPTDGSIFPPSSPGAAMGDGAGAKTRTSRRAAPRTSPPRARRT